MASRSDQPVESGERSYSIGRVAALAHVSVRTLRHYHAIGLVVPDGRGSNGYRRYGPRQLERLQKVLAYRELGLSLADIRALLNDPDSDELEHLRRQKALLDKRAARIDAMRHAVRKILEARTMGIELDPKEMLEVFGDVDPSEHAEEAEQRWGDTEAYRQSRERSRRYRKEDWLRIKQEADDVEERFARALAGGVPAADPRAMDIAEAHRRHIVRWFYDCGYDMHAGLADMYVSDPRFRQDYERRAAGLAEYVSAAIHANAERHA